MKPTIRIQPSSVVLAMAALPSEALGPREHGHEVDEEEEGR